MKFSASVLAVCLALSGSAHAADAVSWKTADEILARIKAPTFPNRDFAITGFGAVAGGKTDCTAAIAKAIAACNQAGGGRVVVPPGSG